MILRAVAAVAVAVALAGPAPAASTLQAREQGLEARVMCPTCHQLLSLSHAPVAERMRSFIRARLAAGASDGAIEHELVADFGPAVLAEPPAHGFGLVAWVVPVGGLAAAFAAVLAVARAWRRRARPAGADDDLSPELLHRLELELAAFDD